jgi:hypothetical protein
MDAELRLARYPTRFGQPVLPFYPYTMRMIVTIFAMLSVAVFIYVTISKKNGMQAYKIATTFLLRDIVCVVCLVGGLKDPTCPLFSGQLSSRKRRLIKPSPPPC